MTHRTPSSSRSTRNSGQPGGRPAPGAVFTPQQWIVLLIVALLGVATLVLGVIILVKQNVPTSIAAQIAPTAPPKLPAPAQPVGQPTQVAVAFACAQTNSTVETGTNPRVIDADTIEVVVDGQPRRVGFAGIALPAESALRDKTVEQVRAAVEGQQVLLIRDAAAGGGTDRQPRYVFIGEHFLNLELVQQGLAEIDSGASALSCAALFQQAEQQARADHIGMWLLAPVPTATFMPMVTLDSPQTMYDCSRKPVCSDFSTHAEAQSFFNACNDYSSKLDDDHDGLACENLP